VTRRNRLKSKQYVQENLLKQIIHSVPVAAPPALVYRALTTAAGLRQWWSTQVEADERQGGVIRFTFTGDFHPHMQQRRLDRDRRVEWVCVAGHENWRDNTFTFALEERKGDTLLMFSQEYARELSDEVYGTYNFNWGYYLNSLKQYCEKGVGVPFAPPVETRGAERQ
jgi:uncharacterized protein YndB with AHSA1/START domain